MTAIAPDRPANSVLPVLTDPDRLAEVAASGLATGADPTLDRLARLASALLDAPRAFVTLVLPDKQHFPGMVRHDDPADTSREQPLSDSVCQFSVATGEPLVIPDSHEDPLVRDMAPVRAGDIGAYAGLPLRTGRGHVFGTLCVVDGRPRPWDSGRLALMEDLTTLAVQEVENRIALTRERRLLRLLQQVTRQLPLLVDAVASLVDIAGEQDEPRLQRYAALTRTRMEPVLALTQQLEAVTVEPAQPPAVDRHQVDLRAVAEKAVRSARAATGSRAIELESGEAALPVRCDGLALAQSISHAIVTALHHSHGSAPVVLQLEGPTARGASGPTGTATGTLTVRADDCRVPTGELARVIARFHRAACGEASTDDPEEPAAVRIAGGTVTAVSGPVRGESDRDGRLVIRAQWPLDV